jgi:amino acid adenylation domain-containing protein
MIPALSAALAHGAILRAAASGLALRTPAPLPSETRAALAAAKPEIQALLGAGGSIGPASAAQRAVWLADAAGGGYAVTAATRLRNQAGFAPDRLPAALAALAARHPSLRTRLLLIGEEPAQMVVGDAAFPLECGDAPDIDVALAHVAAWSAARLDPAVLPAGGALLLRLGAGDWIFALRLHHAFCDAASLDIIAGDLAALLDGTALTPPGPDMLDQAAAERVAPAPSLIGWDAMLHAVPRLALSAEPLLRPCGTGRYATMLPAPAWQAVAAAGRALGATPFATLLGLLGVALAPRAEAGKLLLHTVVTRRRPGFESTVGCFAGLLPIVLDLGDGPSPADAVPIAVAAVAGMLAHDGASLAAIAALHPQAARPVVLFTHRRGGAAIGEALELPADAAKAALALETAEAPDGMRLSLEWDRALIDDGLAAILCETLIRLCHEFGAVAALPAPDAALHAALAPDWPVEQGQPIHALFARHVRAAPDSIAVRDRDGAWQYGQIDAWGDAVAASLGDVTGAVVGIAVPRGAAMVAAWLGCLKAGAAYLPLDPAWPEQGRRTVLAAAGAVRVLHEADLPPSTQSAPPRLDRVHKLALACVFATSGSTGAPKTVGVPHLAIPRLALDAAMAGFAPGDGVAQAGSVAFDATSWEVWGALLNGATLEVLDADTVLDADALAAALVERRITHAFLTKTLFDAVAALRPDAFAGMKTLCVGGEALDPQTCAAIIPPARFVNGYGPTETATFAAWGLVPADVAAFRRVPLRHAVRGTVLRVLDRRMKPADPGAAAELFIGGDALARGYLGQPGLTAERFLPDPFGPPGSRLYRTGDRARLMPDGAIDLLGRTDAQIKIRGFRVEPAEVQAAIRALPDVVAAHVMAVPGPDGVMALLAWVVGAPADAVRTGLRNTLPAAMIPAHVWRVPRLPVTSTGKVDAAALPRDVTPQYTAEQPQGVVEQAVAALAREVLGLETLGRHDDFFALGAHSLAAMRLLARLRARFATDLPLRAVFETPTIAGLARLLPQTAAPGLPAAPLKAAPPTLLSAQDRIWLLARLGGGLAWHIPLALRLRGGIDLARLQAALTGLIARHVALRTGIAAVDGRPRAVLQAGTEAPFAIHLAPSDLMQALAAEAARPFDLETGPFLRGAAWRIGDEDHVLLLVLHHIAADGWSVGVLLADLAALYAGTSLPPITFTTHDWAQHLRAQGTAQDAAFWAGRLAGAIAPRLRLSGRGGPGMVRLSLAPSLAVAARQWGTTAFVLGLTAWSVVMTRRADAPDLLLGTVLAGRDHPQAEALVGMLAQTLPLRLDLGDDPDGTTLLARAMAALEEAHARRTAPFEQLVQGAGEAGMGGNALLPHLIVLQNQPWPEGGLPGLTVEPIALPPPSAKTATTLALNHDLTEAALEYDAALMGQDDAQALLTAFGRVVAALAADPACRVSRLPVVAVPSDLAGPPSGERPPLLAWAAGHAIIEGHGQLGGDALRDRVETIAGRLVAAGIGADDLVGLCAARSAPQLVALLAIIRAGAAWLPLDPDQPAARLRTILQTARPIRVLADAAGLSSLATADPSLRPLPLDAGTAMPAPLPAAPHPDSLAYVLFTSGSTGTPKGVAVSRGALAHHMAWMDRALPLERTDRLLLKTPFGFDASIWEYLAPLRAGAKLHVATPGAHRDPAALLAAIQAAQATVLQLVPSVLAALLREPGFDAACRWLRRLCLGGEAVPRALAEAVRARLPNCRLINLYGPTEATIQAIVQDGLPDVDGPTMPIGRPIDGVRARLTDALGGAVEQGSPGRLWLSGPTLARGYLARPDLTADRFRPDPAGPSGSRALDTGDLVRLDPASGTLEWLGRADRQLNLRGVRVEPAEIEAALLRLAGVAEAAVTALDGPAGPLLAAWVVRTHASDQDAAGWRAALAAELPASHVPARIVVVPVLPCLPNGKLDRNALRLPAEAARPAADPVVEMVAAIMAPLLDGATVGPDDDFFAMGGHSLLAAQLAARLREATGRELPLADLFAAPTPAGIARALAGALNAAPLADLPAGVPLPLGSAQRRLWAAVQFTGLADARWTMGGPMILRGPIDPAAIERSLARIQARHEPLRTRIVVDAADMPIQHVDPPSFRLEQDGAASLDMALADSRAFMARHYDLATELPFRARFCAVGPALCVLSLAVHHIAADGWSLGVLQQELASLLAEEETALPPVMRYAAVAAWMDAQDTAPALAWWRRRLAGMPPLRLPQSTAHAATVGSAALAVELDGAARRLARDNACTVFMALAAGFAVALFEVTGQTDIGIGTEVADRRHVAADRLIGFFANPMVLRMDLSGDPTVRILLARVRQTALETYRHQHVPGDRILAAAPPVGVKLNWQAAPSAPARLAGCEVEWPQMFPKEIPGDVLLNLADAGDGVAGALLHRPAVLDPAAARALMARFASLLRAMAASPEARVSALIQRAAPPVADLSRRRRGVPA